MERPAGTVTFLFTDIEGSTQLLRDLGERYAGALADHRNLLRAAFEDNNGYEVDTQGDAFFAAFPRARDAVRAAAAAQLALASHAWADGKALRVRMGIHTCEAAATSDGYVGIGVHRGARIAAAGHGGQVLLSQTTRDLLEEEGANGLGVRDLGEHRLKDLTQPQRLYQLVGEGLDERFPPLATLENRPTNLPAQATALVGRERELAELSAFLRREDTRLVTLTGPGGTGKTRLALQAAAELVDDFTDGVFLVALAPIVDPALVVPEIGQSLGISEAGGQSLEGYLAGKRILLVLDNFEQVLEAAPEVAGLLSKAAELKAVVTSREPLRLSAERVYPVPPLGVPDPEHPPDLASWSQYEGVALFVERAQAAMPDFEVTSANAPAVAEICVRLDGLPLAIELAAARIPLLPPDAMLTRLDDRLKLLIAGARDAPARHQTLRDTIAWSFDLLDPEEQALFAQLAVFSGDWTLEAAEAVCEASLATLGSLLNKNLIRQEDGRFGMLETIREFAAERLAESEDQQALRARHADFFATLAEAAYEERFTQESRRSDELEREHDNLRGALEWLAATDREHYLRLAGSLGWFWHVHSHLAEGRMRLAAALEDTTGREPLRARALSAQAEVAAWQGDIATARPAAEEAIEIWRELGSDHDVALVLHELGWGLFWVGDDAASRSCMEQAVALQRALGDPFHINRAQTGLLQVLVSVGDGDTVERLAPDALGLARQLGDRRSEHLLYHYLADSALIRGDAQAAEERYLRSLEAAIELGDRVETALEVQGVAMSAAGIGRSRRALKLGGAAGAALDALGLDVSGVRFWNELLERYLGAARRELGEEATAAWDEGRRLGFEDAVEIALDRSRD